MNREWVTFDLLSLEEILASLNDSDRYCHYGTKMKIIEELEKEIKLRNNE